MLVDSIRIVEGHLYIFKGESPKACVNHQYRVWGITKHYPSLGYVIAYEGLTGPDAGKKFSCTGGDFLLKFKAAPPPPPVEEKVVANKEGPGF